MRRIVLAACCSLLVAPSLAAAALLNAPVEVWTEMGPDQASSNGSVYYGGGVFNNTFYTGQLNYGPVAYSRTQTGGTAYAGGYDTALAAGSKSSVVVGDYVFWSANRGGSWPRSSWQTEEDVLGISRVSNSSSDWSGSGWRVNPKNATTGNYVTPEALATDGTHLFTNDDNSRNTIHGYSVTNYKDVFTLNETFATTVTGATRFRALSYCDGYVYVVDYGDGNDFDLGIYAVDASTGAATTIGTFIGYGGYQAVRYDDQLLLVGLDDNLTVYDFAADGLLLDQDSAKTYALGQGDLYGLGVVGDGTDVTGFWVTSANAASGGTGEVSYYSTTASMAPEPGSLTLMGMGFLGLLAFARRKQALRLPR